MKMDPDTEQLNRTGQKYTQRISINSSHSASGRLYQGDRWTPLLALSAATSTLGFAVPAGYCLGVLNTPTKILQKWCNDTLTSRDIYLSDASFDILWSLIVSVFLIGGVIGGLTGAWFANKLGRKGTLISGNILNIISSIMFLSSKYIPSVEIFFLGRVIVGFIAGLMTTVIPMYLTELSPPKLSGFMGVLFPVGLTFGILVSQIMGLDWLLGTTSLWPFLVSLYFILAIFVFVFLPWLPESPKYLYNIKKEEDKALEELSRLRNLPHDIIAWEIVDNSRTRRQTRERWNLFKVLFSSRLRLPLLLVVALQAGQQLSGINAVFYFSSNIFDAAGLSEDTIPYANIGTGFINFLVNACGLILVHSFGRRPLLIFSCSMTSLTLILLTLSSKYTNYAPWVPHLSVAFTLAFVFFYDIGLGPIPFFIGAELVDIGPRPIIMALGSVANWGANFLVGSTYITLHSIFHESLFLIFAFFTLSLMLFIIIYLPETKEPSTSTDELTHEDPIMAEED